MSTLPTRNDETGRARPLVTFHITRQYRFASRCICPFSRWLVRGASSEVFSKPLREAETKVGCARPLAGSFNFFLLLPQLSVCLLPLTFSCACPALFDPLFPARSLLLLFCKSLGPQLPGLPYLPSSTVRPSVNLPASSSLSFTTKHPPQSDLF